MGRIVTRVVRTLEASLCRDCGEAMYRAAQNETLIKGWWGVISFFANFVYIFSNWFHSRNLAYLGRPTPTPKVLLTPVSAPMPVGPPLIKRLGLWVAAGPYLWLGNSGRRNAEQRHAS
jgi:hypothetical protein